MNKGSKKILKNSKNDKEKFEKSLKFYPDEVKSKSEGYQDVAIEGFGQSLLMKMGLNKEDLSRKTDFKSKIRPSRLGLGCENAPDFSPLKAAKRPKNSIIKPVNFSETENTLARESKQGSSECQGEPEIAPKRKEKSLSKKMVPKTKPNRRFSWAQTGLIVRFISEDLLGGKLYLKKLLVIDVLSPHQLLAKRVDGDDLVTIDYEDLIETVVGRVGTKVKFVKGSSINKTGKIVRKSVSKNTASVQLEDELEIIECNLDDISAFDDFDGLN